MSTRATIVNAPDYHIFEDLADLSDTCVYLQLEGAVSVSLDVLQGSQSRITVCLKKDVLASLCKSYVEAHKRQSKKNSSDWLKLSKMLEETDRPPAKPRAKKKKRT